MAEQGLTADMGASCLQEHWRESWSVPCWRPGLWQVLLCLEALSSACPLCPMSCRPLRNSN